MFKVLIFDYRTGDQYESQGRTYFLDAKEACLQMALDYVFAEEGQRYLERNPKIFCLKTSLKKGYSIVDSSCDLFVKYSVYYKDANGWVISGRTQKVISFCTFRTRDSQQLVCDKSEFAYKEQFDRVMNQLAIEIAEYDEKKTEEDLQIF